MSDVRERDILITRCPDTRDVVLGSDMDRGLSASFDRLSELLRS